jgi:hypothetical protein
MQSHRIDAAREIFSCAASRRTPIELAEHQREVRLRQLAGRLHSLGARPLFEFLRELDGGADMWPRLERYASLNPEFIRALDGDRLPVLRVAGKTGTRVHDAMAA